MLRNPMPKTEIVKAIERKGKTQIPLFQHKWWGEGLEEKYGNDLNNMASNYPDDLLFLPYTPPGNHASYTDNPEYRWGYHESYEESESHSIGEIRVLLPNWDELDTFISNMPNPNEPGNFDKIIQSSKENPDSFKVGGWWMLFHERFWAIRGMENMMMDYYDSIDNLKVLGKELIEYYKVIIDRYAELGFDAIFSSDDLGHQSGPMMSPAVFEDLYLSLYKELVAYIHNKGMYFILHSCGDNSKLMDMLIEAGVDVFHPVQKGCMDLKETVENYGDRITFLVGFDVQHSIVENTPEQIKEEVAEITEVFKARDGGLLMAAGNGILPDTPLENIEAMLFAMSKSELKEN